MTGPEKPNNDAWADALLRTLLDRWVTHSPNPNGLFHADFDRRWRRADGAAMTLVSQCRLIYNFSRGHEYCGEERFSEAAVRGIEALQTYFRLASGRYRWAVGPDGSERDATLDAYGHAFCILALATAARTLDMPAFAAEALAVTQTLADVFTDTHGGLVWHIGPRGESRRSQNPMMHAFEALMALHTVDATGRARTAAAARLAFVGSLADFASGALNERYTTDWEPLPSADGGVVDLGHAFEWAYLLSDWHGITQDVGWLRLGENFLRTGMAWGMDADGGVRAASDSGGRIVAASKGLWQQAEAIRAVGRYVNRHGREDLTARFGQMQAFYRQHFVDEEFGGVFARPPGLGGTPSLAKGDAWKLDYHSVNMCLELVRANG